MVSQIFAFLGLIILATSLTANAIQGSQIALLGVGFILLGIFSRLGAIHKDMKSDPSKSTSVPTK